jgi:transposase
LTTIRAAGLSEQDDDVRQYGLSKEGPIARQFMLGVVQTAEGLPIYHEVFNGNQAEGPTLMPSLQKVLARFAHIKRLIVVADRGLLSLDNLEELQKIQAFQAKALQATQELVEETTWSGLRLVVAHNPVRAAEQTQARQVRIAALEAQAAQWSAKLDGQDGGKVTKGRRLSDGGATARLHGAVKEAHLSRIVKVDLKSDLFTYTIDEPALAQAELMDGKLLLVTNVADLKPAEVILRYKALADIERGFRVLKSEIEIAPVYHRLPQRIRAHAVICFMALIIYRVMRERLKLAKSPLSPERALDALGRIQRHSITIDDSKPITGISTITADQAETLAALSVKKPTQDKQMNLL